MRELIEEQKGRWKDGMFIGAVLALLPIWEAHYNIAVAAITAAVYVLWSNVRELMEDEA